MQRIYWLCDNVYFNYDFYFYIFIFVLFRTTFSDSSLSFKSYIQQLYRTKIATRWTLKRSFFSIPNVRSNGPHLAPTHGSK